MSKKQVQTEFNDSDGSITPVDEIVIESDYWTVDNTGALEEATITSKDNIVAYTKPDVYNAGKDNEETKINTYVFLKKDGEIKKAKFNKNSLKSIMDVYKQKSWSKLEGKKVYATVKTFGGSSYIEWIAKGRR